MAIDNMRAVMEKQGPVELSVTLLPPYFHSCLTVASNDLYRRLQAFQSIYTPQKFHKTIVF